MRLLREITLKGDLAGACYEEVSEPACGKRTVGTEVIYGNVMSFIIFEIFLFFRNTSIKISEAFVLKGVFCVIKEN